MATEYANSFSIATESGYKTRETAKSSALSSATNSLASLTIDADTHVIENKTIIAGVVVVDAYDTAASGTITISNAANITAQIKATATIVGTAALAGEDGTNFILVNADSSTVTLHTDPTKNFGDTSSDGGDHVWELNTGGSFSSDGIRKATQALWIACKAAIDAGELDMTISPTTVDTIADGSSVNFTLTQTTAGTAGNTAITLVTGVTASGETAFTGGVDAGTHTIALTATDTTVITATADVSATTSSDTVSPTFAIDTGSNDNTAANLTTCLNANSRLTATRVDNVVTVNQVIGGTGGNTTITITDPDSVGMTKADFTGGGGPDLVLQTSHNNTDWVTSTILSSEIAGTVDVYKFLPDLSRVYAPYFRLLLNSGGVNIGTSGTAKFFFAYQ